MIAEALGAFFIAFIYLTQTEEKTKFSKEPTLCALIMAAAYYTAISFASPPSDLRACLNPAIGVSSTIVMLVDANP